MHLMKNLCEFCKYKKRRLGQSVFCRKEQRFVKPRRTVGTLQKTLLRREMNEITA